MSESSMPWIKLYTEMLDDPKLGRLDERCRWRFVQLVLLAGECDAEGYLVTGDDRLSLDDICWRLRADAIMVEQDMASLTNIGVIENTSHGWRVCKFAERQGRKQSEKRQQWRESKARKKESKGPEWEPESVPTGILKEDNENPTPREEKSREEESREETSIGASAPETPAPKVDVPLSPGQKLFTERWNAKRLNSEQKTAILALETQYGIERLTECVVWAREKNFPLGQSIGSIRTAIKNWGHPRYGSNGHGSEPAGKYDAMLRSIEEAERGNPD